MSLSDLTETIVQIENLRLSDWDSVLLAQPPDILFTIMFFVQPVDILRLRMVCKLNCIQWQVKTYVPTVLYRSGTSKPREKCLD